MPENTATTVRRNLEGVLGIPFFGDSSVEALRNGREIFPAMLAAIEQARERIEFLTFVYWRGEVAERFARALAERAAAGVNVRVLLDAVGGRTIDDALVEQMRSAGVMLQWFRPLKRWKVWEIDNRTHRKILVVDGRVGFTGGVGIAAEWEGDARNANEWRDSHFCIRGPAVQGLQGAFYGNWTEAGRRLVEPMHCMPEPEAAGSTAIQVIRATSASGWSDIATLIELLISAADQRLVIATAYFVPDEETIANLRQAVGRGVEVDVIMPGEYTDERLSQLAGEDEYRPLLDAGIRLWRYQRSMYHAKFIVVDGQVACIGSANFNQRSLRKDEEVAAVVLDEKLADTLMTHFRDDLEHCQRIDAETWRQRGLWQRGLEWAARWFKPQV
ncbi:MAG TPA: phospholipase D-like domain-containing protein [Wenzhouxiangella sp.]|nr:phospholipase D-like domain-containing protein [Wenzhouxiangella sp.]